MSETAQTGSEQVLKLCNMISRHGKSTQRYIVVIGNIAEGVNQRYTMQKVSTNQNENDAPILGLYRCVP